MRIGLFVDSVYTQEDKGESYVSSGGIGIYAKELLTALLQEEENNEYLIIRGRPTAMPLLVHPRVTERTPPYDLMTLRKTGLWREWVIRQESIDIIHETEPSAGVIRFSRYPLVVTVHEEPRCQAPTYHTGIIIVNCRYHVAYAWYAQCEIISNRKPQSNRQFHLRSKKPDLQMAES